MNNKLSICLLSINALAVIYGIIILFADIHGLVENGPVKIHGNYELGLRLHIIILILLSLNCGVFFGKIYPFSKSASPKNESCAGK